MDTIFLILKLITFPIWLPFWILKKCWKFFAIIFLISSINGCASNSAKLNMSPCAGCDFQPVNNLGVKHA